MAELRDLNQVAEQLEGVDEEEKRARIRGIHADTAARLTMTGIILLLFVGLNAAVITLVWQAFNTDIALLKAQLIKDDQRLITEKVFMSLIGATVVQVGVTLIAITGYLFPKREV